jgi:aminocarboxymuconate-semialdehyde decarboxylase
VAIQQVLSFVVEAVYHKVRGEMTGAGRRIDIHTHILPESWPNWNEQFGYDGWLTIQSNGDGTAHMMNSDGSLFRVIEQNCWCGVKRIEECDAKSVTIQVLSTVPGIGFNYKFPAPDALVVAKFLNDHLCGVVKANPSRFIGLGTIPLQDVGLAITELRRCVLELGMVGVQIGSSINGRNLEAPDFEPFWTEVEALQCAVFIHPWDMSQEDRLKKHWFQWTLDMPNQTAIAAASMAFGGVFERHPKLRVCFAHGGGSFPALQGRLTHGFDVRPDLCQTCTKQPPGAFKKQMYFDSLVHDEDMLRLIVSKFGSDHVIMGTDYPFPLGEIDHPGGIIEDTYKEDPETMERLLWSNAVDFLGLDANGVPLPRKAP